MECFRENVGSYAVLLPMLRREPVEALRHLRLHNGTIWRWNRPLIGLDRSGRPHVRVEHRVIPAGPTMLDATANMAAFHGLVEALTQRPIPPESSLPFEQAKSNFYAAAREGLEANLVWLEGQHVTAQELWLDHLLVLARQGLERLEIDAGDIDEYLGIMERRVRSGQTGSVWQREYHRRHQAPLSALTLAYRDLQRVGAPVHEWPI
jgi:gamma-glutamyl:cysteine ligase YbdK (ATP-grasp superfamily)